MTLAEAVVALALFAVVVGSVLTVLGAATTLSRDDKIRLAAVDLAARELEITRDTFTSLTRGPTFVTANRVENPNPLPGGVAGEPLVVDRVPYSVVRTAQWAPVGSQKRSSCDEGTNTELAYLRVKVEVTWPTLGSRPPVVMQTVLTPPKGTYANAAGHIGLKVVDSVGAPVANLQVIATGAEGSTSGYTSAEGCVLLAFLTPGVYEVALSTVGHVDRTGNPTGLAVAQVQPGQLWRGTIEYDRAATIEATFRTEPGFALPQVNTIPVALGNSGILPAGSALRTGNGDVRALQNLWPFPSGYQLWAGSCLDNDPQYTGDTRELPVVIYPGVTTSGHVTLAPVEVRGRSNRTTIAVHAADTACPGGMAVDLGVTDAAGVLRTSLPYGEWEIRQPGRSAGVTLFKGSGPVTVVLS